MASYKIIIRPSAENDVRLIPFPFRRQIVQSIHKLKERPTPVEADAIDLGLWSLPVYGYRVVYEVDDNDASVTIVRIDQ